MKIWLNGEFVDKEDAKISVFDHGVLYGDGVFEGIRAYSGKIFRLVEHMKRLFESAKTIELKIPYTIEEMCGFVEDSIRENMLSDAYIRLVVTRGVGDLSIFSRKDKNPNIFIIADKIALYPEEFYQNGLKIITSKKIKIYEKTIPPYVKSTNYLKNILAKIEGLNSGVEEVLMLNDRGYAAECTGDNIFMIDKQGKIMTPDFESGILRGITHDAVIEISQKKGYEIEETKITIEQLYNASEVFLTGTAAEIIPVVEIDNKIIGDGRPGPITQKLLEEFREMTGENN